MARDTGKNKGTGGNGYQAVIDVSAWRKAVDEANVGLADKVPNGWVTVEQLSEALGGYTHEGARKVGIKLCRVGKAERRKFRVFNGTRTIPVMHYRLL